MFTATISDFRKDIRNYLKKVTDNFDTLIIHRGKEKAVVVISLEEYNSLNATQYEMSSQKNKLRLDKSIQKINEGKVFQKELIEE